jgi:hypothetical protein
MIVRAMTCQACGHLALSVATVMEAAAVAVEHNGGRCNPSRIIISPVRWPA